jgi:hypothetical protein
MTRADLRKCEGNTGGSSAREERHPVPLHRSYEFLLNSVIRTEDAMPSATKTLPATWNLDLARDHPYWVLPRPNDLCYADPIGRSAASAKIALLRSPEPRCISPKLPENSSPTRFRDCRTGRGPAHLSRYEVRRASPVPSVEVIPGTDIFGLCSRRAAFDPI